MKSRLAVSFSGVADRKRKHLGKKASGIRGARAPGWRIDWAFLGRLAFGPSPLGAPGWRICRAFLGRLAFGPGPIGALGLGRLARGTEPGLMVPTVGIGLGNFNNETGPKNYNLNDPPYVDIIGVPKEGWAAIRLRADNLGMFFFYLLICLCLRLCLVSDFFLKKC